MASGIDRQVSMGFESWDKGLADGPKCECSKLETGEYIWTVTHDHIDRKAIMALKTLQECEDAFKRVEFCQRKLEIRRASSVESASQLGILSDAIRRDEHMLTLIMQRYNALTTLEASKSRSKARKVRAASSSSHRPRKTHSKR